MMFLLLNLLHKTEVKKHQSVYCGSRNQIQQQIKSLLLTCCEISKCQPVTHLMINNVECEDLTPAEAPVLSRNVQAVSVYKL